jgi:hypothetical protein
VRHGGARLPPHLRPAGGRGRPEQGTPDDLRLEVVMGRPAQEEVVALVVALRLVVSRASRVGMRRSQRRDGGWWTGRSPR